MPAPISPPQKQDAPSHVGSDRRVLIAAGVAQYPKLAEDEQLPSVTGDLTMIVDLFEKELRYEVELPVLRADPSSTLLKTELENWFTAQGRTAAEVVVLYFSGHGTSTIDGEHYLVTSDCDGKKLTSTAMATSDLGRFLRDSPVQQLLLLIDTCDSGQGAHNFLSLASSIIGAKSLDLERPAGIYAIAACLPRQLAEQSAFANAFRAAVLDAVRGSFAGGETQEFLYVSSLIGPINEHLRDFSQRAQMSSTAVLREPGFIRNPRYRPNLPPGLDLQTRKHADLTAHWGPRSRGLDIETQHGFFFTGRQEVMSELVRWVQSPVSSRPIVVTGQPGCGKSAVLSRLVTLSDPEYRPRVEPSLEPGDPVPPVQSIWAAIRCSAKRPGEIAGEIGAHFGRPDVSSFEALVEVLGHDATPRVIVLDALDEAIEPERTARTLLAPLSTVPGIRMLVGTREQGVDPLGPRFRVLDLDHPENLGIHDIAGYVQKILVSETAGGMPSPYAAQPELSKALAESIAERATPNFLVARIVACSLLEEPELVTNFAARDFPDEVGAAFGEYLSRFGDETPVIRDVLLALAFAQGAGLPWESIWPVVITAITGRQVTAAELESAVERAGAFIIEDNEAGRSVYRLFHEALADHLRAPYKDRLPRIHRAIAEALLQSVDSDGAVRTWPLAHPYLRRHLVRHAALGGYIDTLLRDPWFVVHSRPEDILRVLPHGGGRDRAGVYKSVVHRMRENDPYESLSYLEMGAQQMEAPDVFDWSRVPGAPRQWKPLWASWQPDPVVQRVIAGHPDAITTLAAMTGERTIIASGSWDGTVLLWDIVSGIPLGDPLQHPFPVKAAVFSRVRDRDVVITAPYGAAIRMWFLDDFSSVVLAGHEFTTAMIAMPFRRRPAIAFGTIMGEITVVDLESRAIVATTTLEPAAVYSLTLHALDKPVIVIGGHADGIWSWQPGRAAPIRFPDVTSPTSWVASAAATTVGGRPVLVADGEHCIALWDPETRQRIGEIPTGRDVAFVTAASTEGGAVAIVGGDDGSLRIVDLERRKITRSLGHDTKATAALLVPTREGMTLVSGNALGVLRVRELGQDIFTTEEPAPARSDVWQVAIASDEEATSVAFLRSHKLTLCDADSGAEIPHHVAGSTHQIAGGILGKKPAFAALTRNDHVMLIQARTGEPLYEWEISDLAVADSIGFATIRDEGCAVAATSDVISILEGSQTRRIELPEDVEREDVILSPNPELPYAAYATKEGIRKGIQLWHLDGSWNTFIPDSHGRCVGVFERAGRPFAIHQSTTGIFAETIHRDTDPDTDATEHLRMRLPSIGDTAPIHTVVANGRQYLILYGPYSQLLIAEIEGENARITIDVGAKVTGVAAASNGCVVVATERGVQMLRVVL